mmetsp:Transcript_28126/g.39560  ORF Transcript_28126/g.39560 Transcript_28126/m.39560 type:complete len:477 (-) Transcript_28126:101-1531(-)
MSTEDSKKKGYRSSRRGVKGPYNLFFDDLKMQLTSSDKFGPDTPRKDIAKYIAAQWRNLDVERRAYYEIRAIDEEKRIRDKQKMEEEQKKVRQQHMEEKERQRQQLQKTQIVPPTTTSAPPGGFVPAYLKPKGVGSMLAAAQEQTLRRKMEDQAMMNQLKAKKTVGQSQAPAPSSQNSATAEAARNRNPLYQTLKQALATAGADSFSNQQALLDKMSSLQRGSGAAPQASSALDGAAQPLHPEAAVTEDQLVLAQQIMLDHMHPPGRALPGAGESAPGLGRPRELPATAFARRAGSRAFSQGTRPSAAPPSSGAAAAFAAAAAAREAAYYEDIAARHHFPRAPHALEMSPHHFYQDYDFPDELPPPRRPNPRFLQRRAANKFAKAGVPPAALAAADRAAKAAYEEALAAATAASEVAASVYEETLMAEMEVALAQRAAARRQHLGINSAGGQVAMPPSTAAARNHVTRVWGSRMQR